METEEVNLSEESDSDTNWQTIPIKRKINDSPKLHQRKRSNSSHQPSTSSNNKYDSLDNEQLEGEEDEEEEEAAPKPPPIYIPNVGNIIIMIKKISTIIPVDDFNYKSLKEGQVRLMVKNVDSYRKIIKYFEDSKISFHTFQLKQEKSFRFVIKGLHHSTPISDIKAALLLLGHQVRIVTNAKSRATKEPLSMFFVEVDPNPNNKSVYDIKFMNNALVKVEPPFRTNDLVQCHRCQLFGHTKAYCKRPFRCVKCGMDHPTSECKKPFETPPRCLHCLKNHTASYKGCEVYQDLISKRPNRQRLYPNSQRNSSFTMNSKEYPQLHGTQNHDPNQTRYNVSYSDTVKSPNSNFNSRLEKLENLMENLMNMMSMLMTKICK